MAIRSKTFWASWVLNHRAVTSIGILSYSLYLWQQLFLNSSKTSFVCSYPQNVIFAFLAAALSYCVIERPFLALKSRFSVG
jgi:peptidoglycan/LPS O-acetylase OafA/YrhL